MSAYLSLPTPEGTLASRPDSRAGSDHPFHPPRACAATVQLDVDHQQLHGHSPEATRKARRVSQRANASNSATSLTDLDTQRPSESQNNQRRLGIRAGVDRS